MKLAEIFKLGQARELTDLDRPDTTIAHAEIIREKVFLKRIYIDFYGKIKAAIGEPEGKYIVELGSGGGCIKEVISNAVTSDVIDLPAVDMAFSAEQMPFGNSSVDAICMIDVLHHIKKPRSFFTEAQRCLKKGGKVVMIEPANTLWGRFIYKNFHHESFDTKAGWETDKTGPLSDANGALPWIIFQRDRNIFQNEFPNLKIVDINYHTPLRYIISGGLIFRQLLPTLTYRLIVGLENCLSPFGRWLGMFETIVLEKQ